MIAMPRERVKQSAVLSAPASHVGWPDLGVTTNPNSKSPPLRKPQGWGTLDGDAVEESKPSVRNSYGGKVGHPSTRKILPRVDQGAATRPVEFVERFDPETAHPRNLVGFKNELVVSFAN